MAWSGLCNRTDEVVGWRDDKSRASLMVGAAERRSAPCFWSTRGKSDIMRRTFAVGCFSVVTEVACAAVTTFFSGGFFFFFFFHNRFWFELSFFDFGCCPFSTRASRRGFRGTKRPRAPLFPERGEQTRPTGPWVSTAEQQCFSLSNREYLG